MLRLHDCLFIYYMMLRMGFFGISLLEVSKQGVLDSIMTYREVERIGY